MDSDEIRSRLTAAIPSGNIYWSDEAQADQLLPTVKELMADVLLDGAREWQDIEQDLERKEWLPVVRWLRSRAEALTSKPSDVQRRPL